MTAFKHSVGRNPIVLDLLCGDGGCAHGLQKLGCSCIGIDWSLRCCQAYRALGYPCHCMDVYAPDTLSFILRHLEFDAIVCSPDCRGYSNCSSLNKPSQEPRQVPEARELCLRIAAQRLQTRGQHVPFWIENVPNALSPWQHMQADRCVLLCGTQFGLHTYRHRVFECHGFPVVRMPPCNHVHDVHCCGAKQPLRRQGVRPCCAGNMHTVVGRHHSANNTVHMQLQALGLPIDFDHGAACQAVPPLYAAWLGASLCCGLQLSVSHDSCEYLSQMLSV